MLNLSIILEESSKKYPNNTSFIVNDDKITYKQLDDLSNKTANALIELGLQKGDKVALTCPNILYFPIIYYGILKAGGIVVPLNILLKPSEIAYHIKDSEAKFHFCFQGSEELPTGKYGYEAFKSCASCEHFIEILNELNTNKSQFTETSSFGELILHQNSDFDSYPTEADDVAVILYTSGTTGQAKGAQLTHFNMFYNAKTCTELFDMSINEKELIILPLFHSFGQTVMMNATIIKGSSAVLMPRFEPKAALDLMVKHQITVFAGVPTIYWALLNHPEIDDYAKKIQPFLKLAASGGAALPISLLEDFNTKFEVPFLEGYGLSETSPVACFHHLNKKKKAGSIGTPIWGVSMQIHNNLGKELPIDEVGEIVIKGHNVMKSYLNRPEETKEAIKNGWFYTGDLGKKDADGYFYIVDRSKDMIIRGGFNVYPREIEECIIKHEAVSLVAVIGIDDEKNGEEIKAFIQLKEGKTCSKKTIIDYCKEHLASYKYPRSIEFVASLPISATGKILKRMLK